MITIPSRSFSGPGIAQFALMLLVCAGFVLLLPEPVSSDRDGVTEAGTPVCAGSPAAPQDHQWTDDAGIDVPDSCDDEDDDDDGDDDDSSAGSGHAVTDSQHMLASDGDTSHLIQSQACAHPFRPLDAHSLRGPPSGHQESSDAEFDADDDDDDSVSVHHSDTLAAANTRHPGLVSTSQPFRAASIGSANALRAPPQ